MSLVILRGTLAIFPQTTPEEEGKGARGAGFLEAKKDSPPNNDIVEHLAPQPRDRGAEFRTTGIDGVIVEEIAHLVVHGDLLLVGRFLVVFEAVEPEAQDNHEVEAAEGMLDAPIGSAGTADPLDALQSDDLDAVDALLDHLDHFLGALDLVAGRGHGGGDLVGVVVAQRFLDGLEVDLEPGAGVAVDGHGVEDERVAFVRRAELHHDGLGLAEVEGFLPGVEGETQLVFGHDVLQRFEAALV